MLEIIFVTILAVSMNHMQEEVKNAVDASRNTANELSLLEEELQTLNKTFEDFDVNHNCRERIQKK